MDLIPARNFTPGREDEPRLIVVHTAETNCAPGVARAIARWFAGRTAPEASAHYIVGPDELIQCVAEDDTAWHAPGVNGVGIGIELTARAGFTAAAWAQPEVAAMLERAAELVADICRRRHIPIEAVDERGLLDGARGITTHVAATRAFKRSTHWDPGPAFPMAAWLARVRAHAVPREVAQRG